MRSPSHAGVRIQADCAWSDALDDCIAGLSWSFDGTRLAAASVSGSVAIWDAAAGRRLAEPKGHDFGCTAVEFAAGGHCLATAGQDGYARLWDASGAEIAALESGARWVEHLAWHPRGQWLATAAGKHLRIWDNAGRLVRELPGHNRTIAGLAWRSSADCLASAANGEVLVWRCDGDIALAAPALSRLAWSGAPWIVRWSPDGRYLVTGNQDSTITLQELPCHRDPLQISGYPTKVRTLSFDRGGSILATGAGPVIVVWQCGRSEGPRGTTPLLLEAHEDQVSALAFSPETPLLASGDRNGCLLLWQPGAPERPVATWRQVGGIAAVAWSPDGDRIAIGGDCGNVVVLGINCEK